MKTVRLLVLGALRRRGRAHGYQVRADLESWGAHEWSTATSGSVYHALKSMAGQGLLVAHETVPSEAGGPPRIEYELTDQGEHEYLALLRRALADREPSLDVLGRRRRPDRGSAHARRRCGCFATRARAMEEWRSSITAHLPPDTDLDTWGPVGEVLSLWLSTADSHARWTDRLIRRLEEGAFAMAAEEPRPGQALE